MSALPACRRICRLSFFLLLIFSGQVGEAPLYCQEGFENPVVFDQKSGLGNGSISGVAKDHLGFMWIGTTEGLYRFDGSCFSVFKHDPADSLSISDNFITDVVYDAARQSLWISTQMNGICQMDIYTGKCRRYTYVQDGAEKLKPTFCTWLLVDRRQQLWSGCQQGLIAINPADGCSARLHAYPLAAANRDILLQKRIHATHTALADVHNDSLLWLGTAAGLLQFNKITGQFRRFACEGNTEYAIQANNIRSLYQHPDGAIFCGTYHFGLSRFDPSAGTFQLLNLSGPTSDLSLWRNILHLAPKSPSELWVTTLAGLAVLNLQSQAFSAVAFNNTDETYYYGVRFVDEDGRWWTWGREKLVLFNALKDQFQTFRCPKSLGGQRIIVHKIGEDPRSGRLFLVAQYSGGLLTLDRKSGKWGVILPAHQPDQGNASFQGWDLLRTRRGEWLVLTRDVLYRLPADQSRLLRHPFQPPVQEAFFRSMTEDHQGNLWIGSHYKGLIRLNTADGSSRIFNEVLSRLDGTSGTPGCWQVAEDERRQIWVQRSRGYSVYRPEQDTFFHLFPFGKQEKARVDYFAADKAGRMWVAGTGMGLCLADPSAPELGFRKRLKLGLKNPQCLLVDAKNRIWMGSEEGLAYLSADLNRAVYYPLAYGLDEPVETLALLSSGEIAVGQRGAVHIFHPDRLMHNLEKPRPYLTAFKVFQQEYKTDTLLSHLRVIRLRHDQNYFSFEFSAIGYNLPEEQKFEYRLQGVDPDWINPGKRRYAAYTNLASGDYVFLLRVANNEGLWCEQPYRLAIHISTPWWNTWWARLSLLALLVASLYGLYRFQLRRRLEHAEALRLKELDTVKSRLYTNITHEFRTPLTVINGMAEHIKADPQQWLSEGPDLILRNSQNLLTLVNQMLELRKLEAGMLPAHLVLSDIVAYVRYLTESFHSYAEFKKIDLNVVSQWAHFEMDYDPDKILTIVTNLLSNAIKFTPAGGSITLHIGAPSEQTGGPEHIEISVRDTGIGIPPEELPLIFNRFYQAGASSEGGGTGIGLALSKELAQLLGGNIRVTSSYGQGTVFTVTLPVSRQATSAPAWPDIQGKIRLFPTPVEANQPAPDTRPDHRPLVHIVEDNPDVVRYLRACLEPEYRVAVAADGKAGLEQATAEVPDLVISDVMMPEMDGLEMCLQLKTDVRTSHIPVILLTARADLDSRLQGLRHGADIYLAKPFDKTELALQIRNLLNGRKALQAHYLALATQQQPLPHAGPAPEENAFVLNMRAIVEAHLGDPAFAVERFCREAGMSNSNLHRKLTALTGRSANQFIRYIRLAKACTLLCDPERTIAAVADDCGFNDPVYFARAFKQEFGVSPSEYRHTKGR